jgi:hypothetical protein
MEAVMGEIPTQVVVAPEPAKLGTLARLGRLPAVDQRDRRFSMAAPPTERTFRSWLGPKEIFDQGLRPTCVAFACNRYLLQHNVVNKPPLSFEEFYTRCQRDFDEWVGEAYDGTSIRAGFKLLQSLGYVTRYEWAFTIDQIVSHLLEVGPVVAGTDFTFSMFYPDSHGYLWPEGYALGGHAYLLTAVNKKRINPDKTIGAVRMTNSWSASWGDKGKAWISFDALEVLIRGISGWPGEFAIGSEIKKT